jgi:hypothetical protein
VDVVRSAYQWRALQEDSERTQARLADTNTPTFEALEYKWQTAGSAIPLDSIASYRYDAGDPDQFRVSLLTINKAGTYKVDLFVRFKGNYGFESTLQPPPPVTDITGQAFLAHACARWVGPGTVVPLCQTGTPSTAFSYSGEQSVTSTGSAIITVEQVDLPYEIFLGEIRAGQDGGATRTPFEIFGDSGVTLTRLSDTPFVPGPPPPS